MDKEYEDKITEAIMETYGFEQVPNSVYVRCKRCSRRFARTYIGKPINERIIEHVEMFHSKEMKNAQKDS